jgi:thioredoxin 1|eukprot:g1202.t1
MVKQVANEAEFQETLASAGEKAVVVDFTATWCGPCQMIGPKFVAMAEEFSNVIFIKVDVDQCDETAQNCGISAMPTFQVYKNKEKAEELVGANEAKLREMIAKYN